MLRLKRPEILQQLQPICTCRIWVVQMLSQYINQKFMIRSRRVVAAVEVVVMRGLTSVSGPNVSTAG